MSLQLSVAARNAGLDAYETAVGVSAKLDIYSGSPPANCAAADTGTLLATLSLPSDWMANASGGSKGLAGSWTGTGSAAGTAGYFRIKDSTNLPLTPDAVHALGLKEVARIQQEFAVLGPKMGYTGPAAGFPPWMIRRSR